MRFLFPACFVLAACGNPYLAARQTIQVAKAATTMTDVAFHTVEDSQQVECLKLGPVTDPRYIECMKKIVGAVDIWNKVERIANASWAEADAVVTAAEQKKKGLPVDWMTPVRQGVCVVAESLEFLPASVKQHIAGILALIKTFTCTDK
jgi:hypothetical protein